MEAFCISEYESGKKSTVSIERGKQIGAKGDMALRKLYTWSKFWYGQKQVWPESPSCLSSDQSKLEWWSAGESLQHAGWFKAALGPNSGMDRRIEARSKGEQTDRVPWPVIRLPLGQMAAHPRLLQLKRLKLGTMQLAAKRWYVAR